MSMEEKGTKAGRFMDSCFKSIVLSAVFGAVATLGLFHGVDLDEHIDDCYPSISAKDADKAHRDASLAVGAVTMTVAFPLIMRRFKKGLI